MRFDERLLDEIKSRLRPSEVIGRTVKLRRQGREYVGLSPFTKEKTPSFYVNDDKGQFFDFSSGKTGDIITFLQETERLSFPEAVERLAAEAGVALPALDPRGAEEDRKRQTLQDWLETAAKWFEAELRRPPGRDARAYLERRGLKEEDWARFRLGYAPADRTRLKDFLITKGARPDELVEAGLLIAPEDGGAPYDRFRERIIFPIADARGRVVSFGGRALDPEARAKYLNGPETALFHKGRLVYGLPEARKLLHAPGAPEAEAPPLVVVEGYMDVIACQRAGIAAVAPMGTALGEEQMELLWRLHPEPTLCFDGDQAGRRAASRAIDRALPLLKPGKSFRFATLTGGKDADDVLREQGAAALKAQLLKTTPFVEALFIRERDQEPLDTPERRTALKVRLRQAAASIADKDLAGAYREDLLGRYEALWPTERPVFTIGAAAREIARHGWKTRRQAPTRATEEGKAAARRLARSPKPLAAALALAAVRNPAILDSKVELLATQGFCDQQLAAVADELVTLRFQSETLESDQIVRRLRERGFDDEAFGRLEQAARIAGVGAPFLQPDISQDRARALWSQAFDMLLRLEALERALASAVVDLERDNDSSALMRLKADRDQLRRRLDAGEWADDNPLAVSVH
ncbi:MAG: DNA primase [Caulobacteraceae bacterium]